MHSFVVSLTFDEAYSRKILTNLRAHVKSHNKIDFAIFCLAGHRQTFAPLPPCYLPTIFLCAIPVYLWLAEELLKVRRKIVLKIMKVVSAWLGKKIESMENEELLYQANRLQRAIMSPHQHLAFKANNGNFKIIPIYQIARIKDFQTQFTAAVTELSVAGKSGKSLKITIELYIDNDYRTKNVRQLFWAAIPLHGHDKTWADSAEQFTETFWSLVQNPPPGITFDTTDLQ
jgi:hypothetical protein